MKDVTCVEEWNRNRKIFTHVIINNYLVGGMVSVYN